MMRWQDKIRRISCVVFVAVLVICLLGGNRVKDYAKDVEELRKYTASSLGEKSQQGFLRFIAVITIRLILFSSLPSISEIEKDLLGRNISLIVGFVTFVYLKNPCGLICHQISQCKDFQMLNDSQCQKQNIIIKRHIYLETHINMFSGIV